MELKDLDNCLTKTVWIRRNGKLKAVRIPVSNPTAQKPHPMFPIERSPRDGHE